MSVMDRLVKQVIEKLEAGVVPWHASWKTMGPGRNIISRKPYRGFNWLVTTLLRPYRSSYYMTYKQAQQLGGTVKKGEHGTQVYFFKMMESTREDSTVDRFPFMRYYTVFNLEQCEIPLENMPDHALAELTHPNEDLLSEENKIQMADEMIMNWEDAPKIIHEGHQPAYSPALDIVRMPMFEDFETEFEYYATLFHELTHSTGAKHRLNRKSIEGAATLGFKSKKYGVEELVAELGAIRLCHECHIDPQIIDNSSAYLDSWLSKIKESPKMLFTAANDADKAARYIMGEKFDTDSV